VLYPIQKISSVEKNFPALLLGLDPKVREIYFRGNLDFGKNNFAVIGSRLPSPYGRQVCLKMVTSLAKNGLCIISGMAAGIDSFAHLAALEAQGQTVACLGSGLDEETLYPQENKKLAKRILESGGCLISEYAPKTPGFKSNFLSRNRLIAGLSKATMVVEARFKSGSLNTAWWAKKYGRLIFAVPGDISSPQSKGTNKLLENGALPAANINFVLEKIGISKEIQKNAKLKGDCQEENLILHELSGSIRHIDELIETTGLAAPKILASLANLEIKSKVKNLGGGLYTISV